MQPKYLRRGRQAMAGLAVCLLGAVMGIANATTVTTMAGGPWKSPYVYTGNNDGISTNAQFNYPMAAALDLDGNLYIADHNNSKIRKMSLPSDQISGSTSTLLVMPSQPLGVAVDGSNVLYCITEDTYLRRYDLKTGKSLTPLTKFSTKPTGITVAQDGTGYLYVTLTNGSVYGVSPLGSNTLLTTKCKKPSGIAWTPSGWLAISDAGNNSIWMLNPQTGTLKWLTGLTNVGGGFSDGTTNTARFNQPQGIAAAGDGTLVVADYNNCRVRQVSPSGYVSTLYGIAPASWAGVNSNYLGWVDGDSSTAESRLPMGVAISRDGVVYVTEVFYHLVRAATGSGLTAALPSPTQPVFTPNCGYYTTPITITVSNHVGFVYYTSSEDGADPTAEDTYVSLDATGVGTFVWYNTNQDLSSLRMKSFYGTNSSSTVSGVICKPTAPVIIPDQGYFTNAHTIRVSNDVGVVFYTTNNTIPTLDSPFVTLDATGNGTILWNNPDHDLSWLRVMSFNAFDVDSIIVRGRSPAVTTPGFTPECGLFLSPKAIVVTNDSGDVYYTTNGAQPTMKDARVGMTNGVGYIIWNDPNHDLSALKIKAFSSPDSYSETVSGYICEPSIPVMIPSCGYFPNGTNITIINSVGLVVYTTNNTEPTLASPLVPTNQFGVYSIWFANKDHDLRWLRVKTYTAINVSSETVQGEACPVTVPSMTPDCGLFLGPQLITISNASGNVYFTIDGSDPTMDSPQLAMTNGVGYILWTNTTHDLSWLRLKTIASPDNYSVTVRGGVSPASIPVLEPACGYFPNGTNIMVLNNVGSVVYTMDGTDPDLNSTYLPMTNGVGYIYWKDAIHDLSWLRLRSYSTLSVFSDVIQGESCAPTTPVLTYDCSNLGDMVITVSNDVGTVYYTTDKSEPTTNSTLLGLTNGFGYIIWTNSEHDLTWLKLKSYLRGVSSPTVVGGACPPSDPVFSPVSGYYPDGVTITISNKVGTVRYTTDGTEPDANSPVVERDNKGNGSFFWSDALHDLSYLRLKAFSGDLEGNTVSGQATTMNKIGFVHDYFNGAGSTAVIPIVLDLQPEAVVRTIQFRVEVTPIGSNTIPISLDMQGRLVKSNDYVQVLRPVGDASDYKASLSSAANLGGLTRGFTFSVNGTNAGFYIDSHAVVVLACVPVPVAPQGASWQLALTHVSATSDGKSGDVTLYPMDTHTLTVSNMSYTVGDISPIGWYGAGSFGDGVLRNSDINILYYASSGLYVPYDNLVNSASPDPLRQFCDAFNAMDAYPVDLPGIAGGDGNIDFYDSQTVLARSFGLDSDIWVRSWTTNGIRTATNLNSGVTKHALAKPAISISKRVTAVTPAPGKVWFCQARILAGTVEQAVPGQKISIPIYVSVLPGYSLSGMQFRAKVDAENYAPEAGTADFIPNLGSESLTLLQGASVSDLICVFPLIPAASFSPSLEGGSNYIGDFQFEVPATAQAGQAYTLHFIRPNGADDLTTPYTMESIPGTVWVKSAALRKAEQISDEWKTNFFGSVTNPLASADADPDGDGTSNLQEYIAGTNPTNAESHVQFLSSSVVQDGSGKVEMTWLSAPGKVYMLESTSSLVNPVWTLVTNLTGDGYVQKVSDTRGKGGTQFYRLKVQQP